MKLIHTADLHLGASSTTHFSATVAKKRRRELLQTFGAIADLAVSEGARAVLIAGDLFDTANPSAETVDYVIGTVRRTPGIRYFCLPGNHDGGRFPDVPLPENLTVFSDRWERHTLDDVDVYGIATGTPLPYEELLPDSARKNVVLLHGAVREGGKNAAGAVILSRLAGRGIDYLALGHYHAHSCGRIDGRGLYAYAGTPAGRGFDEVGETGVLILDTDDLTAEPVFRSVGARPIAIVEADLSGIASFRDIEGAVARAIAPLSEKAIVRVVLTGALPPEAPRRDLLHLSEIFGDRFFHFEAVDKTRLLLDLATYENSLSLKGEFIRRVKATAMSEEDKDTVIAAGLAALRGEEIGL